MTARILDGKALAQTIQEEIACAARELKEKHNITPGLATILVGDDPASHIYVKNKSRYILWSKKCLTDQPPPPPRKNQT